MSLRSLFIHGLKPAAFLASIVLFTGCAGSGTAKLQLTQTNVAATQVASTLRGASDLMTEAFPTEGTAVTPTVFQMKIIQAYLVEDVDPATQNNVGQVSRIWVNSSCPSDDGCRDSDVGFFDLVDPTAANAALSSQAREIKPGTYRYVRIEFCQGGASGNNVKYKTADMAAEVEATYGGCGETSAALATPLSLGKGDTVTIALDYDLSKAPLYTMPSGSCTASSPCLGGVTLSPRIAK